MNTALSPALHMHSVNHVKFKDGFFAVDEAQRHLKTGESATARRVWTLHASAALQSTINCRTRHTFVYRVYSSAEGRYLSRGPSGRPLCNLTDSW